MDTETTKPTVDTEATSVIEAMVEALATTLLQRTMTTTMTQALPLESPVLAEESLERVAEVEAASGKRGYSAAAHPPAPPLTMTTHLL